MLWTLTALLSLTAALWLVSFTGENPRLALPHTMLLRRQNNTWKARMDHLNRVLDSYDYILEDIEERDDEVYRMMFGLKDISAESRNAGTHLTERMPEFEYIKDSELEATLSRLDAMSGRVVLRSDALTQMMAYTTLATCMADAIPSIPPLMPSPARVRFSSSFGVRTDPVYGGRRMHNGVDFSTNKGYPVYATGDGVVEQAHTQFYGYGREIILNHGYGYKTRYAHLSKILVSQGETVHRGQLIGLVGNSGKSTGPHLHYEVMYRGACMNPMSFMDFSMDEKDYKELIAEK